MFKKAIVEQHWPVETVDQMRRRGPRALVDLQRLTYRGDWRTRAMAVSAIGRIVAADPHARRRLTFRNLVLRWSRVLRGRLGITGWRGALVTGHIEDRLSDNSWFVRFAAALALGDCGDPRRADALRSRLGDPFRPVRMAAAASMIRCGLSPGIATSELLHGAAAAPARLGDTLSTLDVSETLVAAHMKTVEAWCAVPGASAPPLGDSLGWTRHFLGEMRHQESDTRAAEIERYARDPEDGYNLTKPFNPVNRPQNARLIGTFSVVAQTLQLPLEGLILDLAGGPGWVGELLARLGYRCIEIDISMSLLRVARKRFAQAGIPFRGAAGDMTRLPYASGVFDAVVVIDALHHATDLAAVFREVARVMRPGGQFVFAEPGEGHSETEQSLREAGEHHLHEAEIHVSEAARYAGDAGFDTVHVIPHFAPETRMCPEDLQSAAGAAVEDWRVTKAGKPCRLDETLIQSMHGHPIMVFSKGRRAVDSREPHLLRARIEADLRREHERVMGTVRVVNDGDTTWLRGSAGRGVVRVGIQLLTPEHQMIDRDFARADLPADVPPGHEASIGIDVYLPDPAAAYVLKVDLVDELICWFEDTGGRPVHLIV